MTNRKEAREIKKRKARKSGWLIAGAVCGLTALGVGIALVLPRITAPAAAQQTPAATEIAVTSSPTERPSPTPEATPIPLPSPTPLPTPVPTPTITPVELEFPYLLEVDKGTQIVTVYTIDANGEYTVPVKYMLCSTGKRDSALKDGTYRLKDKSHWRRMLSASPLYAQYCSRITGSFLFHSLTFTGKSNSLFNVITYDELGYKASGGCVRLFTSEAKWVYDNVPTGTAVRVITSETVSPEMQALWDLLKPDKPISSGAKYDPTDPEGPNPITPPGSEIRNTPYPGVTPAPIETFSPDLPKVVWPPVTPTPDPGGGETGDPGGGETGDPGGGETGDPGGGETGDPGGGETGDPGGGSGDP
ncbi:MAG: L,D-transpeptidase family protein [Christensenellales bacterium]